MPIDLRVLRRQLLAWFDLRRRDLPWRHNRDPYRIWVSEVMLQQTTVTAVVPYFLRFIEAFPTLATLAAADEQAVLRLWEGLGYYRRARHLHRAARILQDEFAGIMPDDPIAWARLPGVGRYILGAVLSQAFDRRLPVVEANSMRVLCRVFGYEGDPRSTAGQKCLWETAEKVLPQQRVGDHNQALMELGALVCTPTSPKCDICPLSRHCVARIKGLQEQIPRRATRPRVTQVHEVAIAIRRGERFLLAQRPSDSKRWADMWEFPHGELSNGESYKAAARRMLPRLTGLSADLGSKLLTIHHGVTRFRITLVGMTATYRSGRFRTGAYQRCLWLTAGELADYPMSAPQRKLATASLELFRRDSEALRRGARR